MVDFPDDVAGTLVVACQMTEERADHCHVQRARHSFSSHVADDEEQLVAIDNIVVEVAPHFLRRCHGRIDIQPWSLREVVGQHGHLDVMCNAQFTLYTFFFDAGTFQFVHIPHE